MVKQNGLMGQSLLPKIAVVILAGGQSSRMGSNKALLANPAGGTLLDHACDIAARFLSVCGQDPESVFVSGSYPDRRSIPDIIPGCGPLSGMHAVLSHMLENGSGFNYLIFIPIDMPALDVATLKGLVEFVVSNTSDCPEAIKYKDYELPLLIAVKPEIEALLVHRLTSPPPDSRAWAIKEFLKDLEITAIEPQPDQVVQFINVNRPADYHEWSLGVVK